MSTTVIGKSQAAISAVVVAAAKIEPGTHLAWSVNAGTRALRVLMLPSREQLARPLMGSGRQCLRHGHDLAAGLCRESEEDAAERMSTLVGKK